MSRIVPKNDGQRRGGRNVNLGPLTSRISPHIPVEWVQNKTPITALRLRTLMDNLGITEL